MRYLNFIILLTVTFIITGCSIEEGKEPKTVQENTIGSLLNLESKMRVIEWCDSTNHKFVSTYLTGVKNPVISTVQVFFTDGVAPECRAEGQKLIEY